MKKCTLNEKMNLVRPIVTMLPCIYRVRQSLSNIRLRLDGSSCTGKGAAYAQTFLAIIDSGFIFSRVWKRDKGKSGFEKGGNTKKGYNYGKWIFFVKCERRKIICKRSGTHDENKKHQAETTGS